MRARLVFEDNRGKKLYNRKQVTDLILQEYDEEVRNMVRGDFDGMSKDEFNEVVEDAGFINLGPYWTVM